MTEEERFWAKVTEDESGCWLWTASAYQGYGTFRVKRGSVRAHKWAYEFMVGPVPDGLELDHLCRNRGCVNPDHLDPVSHAENVRRGIGGINQRVKTHCPKGHEYTPENTRRWRNERACRACERLRDRSSRRRVVAA